MSLFTSSSSPHTRNADDEPAAALGGGLVCDPPEALEVEARTENGYDVITVSGEIDLATAPQLSEVLRTLLASARHIVLDLDQVTFIDSTGLSVLVATHRRVTGEGGSIALVCNNRRCMRVMEITGLRRLFTFRSSVADATGVRSPAPELDAL